MARLLIAGAGYLGQALAERVLMEGKHDVSILRRSAVAQPGVTSIQADLLRPETLTQLPDFDDVVYCASADASDEESYRKIYQHGLQNLVQALRARGRYRRLVYISSTSVYAEHGGAWVDESDPNLVKQGPSRYMV
ncbi:MAG: NAD-dependent epimerase/dehydratase family protein, partial [Pseudobdellovibrionaceae bacterium]|nr:NAD-dependent epimerase/dehydratase family protein [Pseudobdellovibrionaceae bacterium]